MGIEHHGDHWRWVGGPVPPGAAAITIGPVISLRRQVAGHERLLRHELAHVAQWRRLGVAGFLVAYLRPYLRWRFRAHGHWDAYRRIPLEIAAEWQARLATGSS